MYGKIRIIQASNKYTDQIIKRIDRVYGEYGYWVNTNKYDKDLLDIEKNYCSKKGCFWLAMHNSRLVGTIAVKPIDNQLIEIKRLYVEKKWRGTNISMGLYNYAYTFAYSKNYKKIILWSDTKFDRAHSFYLKLGFSLCGKRIMNDADQPYEEFLFCKNISLL